MAETEVVGGMRTKYRGSEEDWAPTKKFIEKWREETRAELSCCFVRIADVNYATDDMVDGARAAHYEFETYYGIERHARTTGWALRKSEKPESWVQSECLMVDVVLPYSWFNPELEAHEPGHIQIQLAAPKKLLGGAELLLWSAHKLERRYNDMIDAEYPGSHNKLLIRNAEAEFSVKIAPYSFP